MGTVEHDNWQVVAVSDSSATLCNLDGLDVDAVKEFKGNNNQLQDYNDDGVVKHRDYLLSLDVDVLVLAAHGNAITEDNVNSVKADYVVELANGPVSQAADQQLQQKNVTVVPDLVANAGGVIVSYYEWLQNRRGEHWSEDKVNLELKRCITEATVKTQNTANEYKVDLRIAAYINALLRLIK